MRIPLSLKSLTMLNLIVNAELTKVCIKLNNRIQTRCMICEMKCHLDDVIRLRFLFFTFRWRHWNHGNLIPVSASSTHRLACQVIQLFVVYVFRLQWRSNYSVKVKLHCEGQTTLQRSNYTVKVMLQREGQATVVALEYEGHTRVWRWRSRCQGRVLRSR